MALFLREYLDNNMNFAKTASDYDGSLNIKESSRDNGPDISPDSLMIEIEGIHAAPFATRNYTRYTAKCLKNSIPSWTQPYNRPLIKHHNEENGDVIGRVIAAEYLNMNTLSGTPAIKFTVNVPDEKAKQDIQSGLLSTTSIGVIAHDVRCSICGASISDASKGCEEGHQRGVTYNTEHGQETCYWDIHEMEAKELSFVNVPSDMYAQKTGLYPASSSSSQPMLKESLDNNINPENRKGEPNMAENNKPTELEEAKAKVSELSAKVAELEEAAKASEKTVAELEESKKTLEAKVTELEEAKKTLETQGAEEKQLREGLEQEMASVKTQLKEAVAETFVTMREALGSEKVDIETIKNRSMDSLRDSIMDMKESLAKTKAAPEEKKETKIPEKVQDPTLKESMETKKENKDSIDLRAGLRDIFSYGLKAQLR